MRGGTWLERLLIAALFPILFSQGWLPICTAPIAGRLSPAHVITRRTARWTMDGRCLQTASVRNCTHVASFCSGAPQHAKSIIRAHAVLKKLQIPGGPSRRPPYGLQRAAFACRASSRLDRVPFRIYLTWGGCTRGTRSRRGRSVFLSKAMGTCVCEGLKKKGRPCKKGGGGGKSRRKS